MKVSKLLISGWIFSSSSKYVFRIILTTSLPPEDIWIIITIIIAKKGNITSIFCL